MSKKLIEQLKRHEGLRLTTYRCSAGVLTIGYGRNLEQLQIDKSQAEVWLIEDIEKAADDTRDLYATLWHTINHARQDCLINMCFNLGKNGLSNFKKMKQAIENKDYQEAARQMMDSRWASQVGKRATELAKQMKTGEYAS